jgi:hypothetical protein
VAPVALVDFAWVCAADLCACDVVAEVPVFEEEACWVVAAERPTETTGGT